MGFEVTLFLHRSSRFVVSGCSGYREVHCGLQTHGQLQIQRHSCFSGLCVHLDHGGLLCRATYFWLVQVRNSFPQKDHETLISYSIISVNT